MNSVVPNADPAAGSAVPDPAAPNNVVEIECYCPGHPHDSDTVTLAPEVSVTLGIAASQVLRRATNTDETLGELMTLYLRLGVVAWSLVDENGQDEPVTPDNVTRRLTYAKGGFEVANIADDLYSAVVMRPLLPRIRKSSRRGQTGASTPPIRRSGGKRPMPSMPSSPTGTVGPAYVVPVP